jgi:hypothetical protein
MTMEDMDRGFIVRPHLDEWSARHVAFGQVVQAEDHQRHEPRKEHLFGQATSTYWSGAVMTRRLGIILAHKAQVT